MNLPNQFGITDIGLQLTCPYWERILDIFFQNQDTTVNRGLTDGAGNCDHTLPVADYQDASLLWVISGLLNKSRSGSAVVNDLPVDVTIQGGG